MWDDRLEEEGDERIENLIKKIESELTIIVTNVPSLEN